MKNEPTFQEEPPEYEEDLFAEVRELKKLLPDSIKKINAILFEVVKKETDKNIKIIETNNNFYAGKEIYSLLIYFSILNYIPHITSSLTSTCARAYISAAKELRNKDGLKEHLLDRFQSLLDQLNDRCAEEIEEAIEELLSPT